MRVLVVSNLYPPHYVGGYELRCAQVAEALQRAGHEVLVVASSTEIAGAQPRAPAADGVAPTVERWLRYHPSNPVPRQRLRTVALVRDQLREARRFSALLASWKPDVVCWWNMEGLTKAIIALPSAKGIPDVCFVDDSWLIREYGAAGERCAPWWFDFWRGMWGPAGVRSLLPAVTASWERRVQREGIRTRPAPFQPRHVCYVSEYLRAEHVSAGLDWPATSVIHGGVSASQFLVRRGADEFATGPLRLLYAGYVEPNRGLHLIVEAMGQLPADIRSQVRLSIAQTDPPNPGGYVADVKQRIAALGLGDQVTFIGKHPHADMPRVYAAHHVLVSPTKRIEGLPMTMMEALCACCAVVTTGSGGAIELANAAGLPLFPKDDAVALSSLLARLARDRQWTYGIAERGQNVVLEQFQLSTMTDRIGRLLTTLT